MDGLAIGVGKALAPQVGIHPYYCCGPVPYAILRTAQGLAKAGENDLASPMKEFSPPCMRACCDNLSWAVPCGIVFVKAASWWSLCIWSMHTAAICKLYGCVALSQHSGGRKLCDEFVCGGAGST
jgi:hypothetical protein